MLNIFYMYSINCKVILENVTKADRDWGQLNNDRKATKKEKIKSSIFRNRCETGFLDLLHCGAGKEENRKYQNIRKRNAANAKWEGMKRSKVKSCT